MNIDTKKWKRLKLWVYVLASGLSLTYGTVFVCLGTYIYFFTKASEWIVWGLEAIGVLFYCVFILLGLDLVLKRR